MKRCKHCLAEIKSCNDKDMKLCLECYTNKQELNADNFNFYLTQKLQRTIILLLEKLVELNRN